jgi:hypothetical protein
VIAVILAPAALRATMLLAVPLTLAILLVCARGRSVVTRSRDTAASCARAFEPIATLLGADPEDDAGPA